MARCHAMLMIAALGLLLAGCTESDAVVLSEPGVYKGAEDPLLKATAEGELHADLEQRFNAIQTDR